MPTESAKAGQIIEAKEPKGSGHGAIILARHGEPALSRKVKLTAREYREWWALYEAGGLLAGQSPPEHLKDVARRAEVIFTSTRKRSIETATALAEGRELTQQPIFIEAP